MNNSRIFWLISLLLFISSSGLLIRFILLERRVTLEKLILETEVLVDSGKVEEAIIKLTKAAEKSENAKVALAQLYQRVSSLKALETLEQTRVNELQPEKLKSAVILALRLGAIDLAERIENTYPRNPVELPDVTYARAIVALKVRSDVEGAKELLLKILENYPEYSEASKLLSGIMLASDSPLELSIARSLVRHLDSDEEVLQLTIQTMVRTEALMFSGEFTSWEQRLIENPKFGEWLNGASDEQLRDLLRVSLKNDGFDTVEKVSEQLSQRITVRLEDRLILLATDLRVGNLEDAEKRQAAFPEMEFRDSSLYHFLKAVLHQRKNQHELAKASLRSGAKLETTSASFLSKIEFIRSKVGIPNRLIPVISRLALEFDDLPGKMALQFGTQAIAEQTAQEKKETIRRVLTLSQTEPAESVLWLQQIEETGQAFQLAEHFYNLEESKIVPVYIDMLIAADQILKAKSVLERTGDDIDSFIKNLLELRILEFEREQVKFDEKWDSLWSMALANEDLEQLIGLSRIIFEKEDPNRQWAAFNLMMVKGVPLSKEHFLRIALEQLKIGHLKEAHSIIKQAWASYPDDPGLTNNKVYLQLLLSGSNSDLIEEMRTVCHQNPENIYFALTLGAAYLLADLPQEAAQSISLIQIDAKSFPSSSAAVYASILFATGQDGEAKAVSRNIDPDHLLEEEKKCFLSYQDEYF